MAEKKYYIRVPEALVEVSKEIYVEFYRSERRLRTLEEKDQRNGLISYNAFDTDEGLGEEYVERRRNRITRNGKEQHEV